MSAQVIAVNVQIPASTTAPVVADFTTHALRVGYFHRRDWQNLPTDDWTVPGVYVLMTTDGSGIVYVGKSVKLRGRISTHNSDPQIDWQRALVVKRDTSHGFTSADVGYLEGRLAAELAAIPGITVHRGKEDRDDTLPRHMELSLDELLGSILSAVRLAGLDVHKPADLPDEDEDAEGPADAAADTAVPPATSPRRGRRTKKAKLPELVSQDSPELEVKAAAAAAGGDTSVANPPPGATPPPGAKTDKKSGCGCDTDGRGGATALAGGLGVAALLVRRRRR